MPSSRGKARRAQKQKKRRLQRRGAQGGAQAKRQAALRISAAAEQPLRLSAAERERIGYDANHDPEANVWLKLDEAVQCERIVRYHSEALAPSARPPDMQRHAGVHALVEVQLASDDPPEARPALERLRAAGMRRHDAIHAIGWLVTEYLKTAGEDGRIDVPHYRDELAQLTLKRWLAQARA